MPIQASPCPSREIIKAVLFYDPESGIFQWKRNFMGRVKAGQTAGSNHSNGYRAIRIQQRDYLAHRLAWVYVTGSLNVLDQIDHINNDRSDNRFCNLRLSNHSENCRNAKVRKHNVSGLKGVKFDRQRNRWGARITVNGVTHWLGSYGSAADAHAAYLAAAPIYHGEFASGG